jgi:2-keto-4-pentenoate hydratase
MKVSRDELALRLRNAYTSAAVPPLGDGLAKVDYALPAIEIVDSRIADWKITFADTVADNGSSARFVLGNEPRTPI